MFIFDSSNNIFGEAWYTDENGMFSANRWKSTDQIEGFICETTGEFLDSFKKADHDKRISKKHIKSHLCSVTGKMTQFLNFDGETYYDVNKHMPYKLEQEPCPLPSNPNYRSDIHFKK